jgi:hypothetical protein
MAASTTYKLNPASPSSFGSVDLVGGQSFTINRTGDEQTLSSDGKPFVMGSFIDNLSYTVSVEMSQNPKTIAVGDTGTLTLKAVERVNGEGVSVTVLTFTSAAAAAVVTSVDHTVSHGGNSSSTVNFRVVSLDGTTDPITVA